MSGSCQQCGKCCANVLLLSDAEIKKIKKYILTHNIQSVNRQSVLLPYQDICPFLTTDNKCNIYEVRPSICKRYQCYEEPKYDLDYRNLKAINMLKTFYPKEYCANIDLSQINADIKKYKTILYGK